ncbi:MAG: hypothetical protein AAF317_03695 [Pseudomonadota bacterium]
MRPKTALTILVVAAMASAAGGALSAPASAPGSAPGSAAASTVGVGVVDPGLSVNVGGHVEWGESSRLMFIDRMKGALAWSGREEVYHNDTGSVVVLKDVDALLDGGSIGGSIRSVAFTDQTLISLEKILIGAHFNREIIDSAAYRDIRTEPEEYFRVVTGADGRSVLEGRLDTGDAFQPLVQFDRDIGRDFADLRDAGQVQISSADRTVTFEEMDLDENGWPVTLPLDAAGNPGTASTTVMWYPAETAGPDSIYSGTYYLMVEGEGTVDLVQKGPDGTVNLRGIEIDGPTRIPFDYVPNGDRVVLTLQESDPDGTGEYLRNIKIVHEDHLDAFDAGEIFTPEYVELIEDARALRWMDAQRTNLNPEFVEGDFDDRYGIDYYSFNLGTDGTPHNGVPIDAIIALSNKTGTDPWFNVPVNASDAYVEGLAAYVAANLDPGLVAKVEFGNENWNGGFQTYRYATAEAKALWGVMELATDEDGMFLRDDDGALIVVTEGRMFPIGASQANGFRTLKDLSDELGLDAPLVPDTQGWAEWSSMRATEVAVIFEEAFAEAGAEADGLVPGLENVMGSFYIWSKASDILLQGNVWRDADPEAWVDPASVFDSLAVGSYFGGSTGGKDSDLVKHWIETLGAEGAAELLVHYMTVGADPDQTVHRIDADAVAPNGSVRADHLVTGATLDGDTVIDVSDFLLGHNSDLGKAIGSAAGLNGSEVAFGSDIHTYVRLVETEDGVSALELRDLGADGTVTFHRIVTFDSLLDTSLEAMVESGQLILRGPPSMMVEIEGRFRSLVELADGYGVELVAYEGGQHFAAAIFGAFRANLGDSELNDFLHALNASPEIATLYEIWLQGWQDAGAGEFAQFFDYGMAGNTGSWGMIEFLGQDEDPDAPTYKLDVLDTINATGAWWDETRDAEAFLQGVQNTGTEADDVLAGTAEEDLLIGGGGNDLLVGGRGNDALNGGSGANRLDGGDGDDVLVFNTTAEQFDGGTGTDTLKLASGVTHIDARSLDATEIEAIDMRNYTANTLTIDAETVATLNAQNTLTILAESADTINLIEFQEVLNDGDAEARTFVGTDQDATVRLIQDDAGSEDSLFLFT